MTTDQIITSIGLIGIGGILKAFLDSIISSRKTKQDAKQSFKEVRYKTIILLCYSLVYYEKEATTLVINRPDINSIDRLKNELNAEFINMYLFGSDEVIIKTKEFISAQDINSLNEVGLAMRKDLYGIRTQLKSTNLLPTEIL
jgi:hypothetical protein